VEFDDRQRSAFARAGYGATGAGDDSRSAFALVGYGAISTAFAKGSCRRQNYGGQDGETVRRLGSRTVGRRDGIDDGLAHRPMFTVWSMRAKRGLCR